MATDPDELDAFEQAFGGVSEKAEQARDALGRFTKSAKDAGDEADDAAGKLEKLLGALDDTASEGDRAHAAIEVLGGASDALGDTFDVVAHVASKAAEKVGELAEQFGEAALEADRFRTTQLAAFDALEGSAGAGGADAALAEHIAQLTGRPDAEASGAMQRLLREGFHRNELSSLLAEGEDVRATGGSLTQYLAQLARLHDQTRVSDTTIQRFGQTIGQSGELYAALGKQLHVVGATAEQTRRNVEALARAHQIRGIDVIAASETAVQRGTHEDHLGETSLAQVHSLSGEIDGIHASAANFLDSVDFSKVPGVSKLIELLDQVRGSLDPTSAEGKRLAAILGSLSDSAATLFAGLIGADGAQGATSAVDGLLGKGEEFARWVRASLVPELLHIREELGHDIDWIEAFVAEIEQVPAMISNAPAALVKLFSELGKELRRNVLHIGREVAHALGDGLEQGEDYVAQKWNALVDHLPDTVASRLELHPAARAAAGNALTPDPAVVAQGFRALGADVDRAVGELAGRARGALRGGDGGAGGTVTKRAEVHVHLHGPAAAGTPEQRDALVSAVSQGAIDALARAHADATGDDS